jgi:hypothetical protein
MGLCYPQPPPAQEILDRHVPTLIASYEAGREIRDIAEEYEVCYLTVWKMLKRHGVQLRGSRKGRRLE